MKATFVIFKGRSLSDSVGLLALIGLYIVNAFHYELNPKYPLYREAFGVGFVVLSLSHVLTRGFPALTYARPINRALFLLVLFPCLLGLWSLMDPGTTLYGETLIGSEYDSDINLAFYVLRNALLYLPMVVYLYLRGLNPAEIRLVALIAIIVAPFSINSYMGSSDIGSVSSLGAIATLGGAGIAYNTYVPYLTFAFISGIFLLFSSTNRFLKMFLIVCLAITGIFCALSTSRQSVLFILVVLTVVMFGHKESRDKMGKWSILVIAATIGTLLFMYLTAGHSISNIYFSRFFSSQGFMPADDPRIEKVIDGMRMLDPMEWLIGAGLTSVINSGPHNDYVRWSQRVGIPMMILGFMPFFIAFGSSLKMARRCSSDNWLFVYLALCTGFTLYHSLFSYPREEANQAVAVYLGLGIWFGAMREALQGSEHTLLMRRQGLISPVIVSANIRNGHPVK